MTEIGRNKSSGMSDSNGGGNTAINIGNVITLVAEDGQRVTMDGKCVQQVGILRAMAQIHRASPQAGSTATFPLPAVKSTILSKIVEYLEAHKDDPPRPRTRQPVKVTLKARPAPKNLNDTDEDDDDDDDDDNDACTNGNDGRGGERRNRTEGQRPTISPSSLHVKDNQSDGSSEDEDFLYEEYLTNVSPWDQRFMEALDLPALIETTKAVNYLNIPPLLDLCCRTIARQMTGLKTEELRKKFNLQNDLSPEEEAKLAAEFAWIEE